jgi:hypothetical protein
LPESILWREKMPFDQGRGGRHIIAHVDAQISDAELAELRARHPEARLVSKEAAFYFKVWREHFGSLGGRRVFDLFGDYPVMMEGIKRRTPESGS